MSEQDVIRMQAESFEYAKWQWFVRRICYFNWMDYTALSKCVSAALLRLHSIGYVNICTTLLLLLCGTMSAPTLITISSDGIKTPRRTKETSLSILLASKHIIIVNIINMTSKCQHISIKWSYILNTIYGKSSDSWPRMHAFTKNATRLFKFARSDKVNSNIRNAAAALHRNISTNIEKWLV